MRAPSSPASFADAIHLVVAVHRVVMEQHDIPGAGLRATCSAYSTVQ